MDNTRKLEKVDTDAWKHGRISKSWTFFFAGTNKQHPGSNCFFLSIMNLKQTKTVDVRYKDQVCVGDHLEGGIYTVVVKVVLQTFEMYLNKLIQLNSSTSSISSTSYTPIQSNKERTDQYWDHPRQGRMRGLNSAHLCSRVCFKASGAKLHWIACWERDHTASWLRPNVDAAKWYSWERLVQNTPLPSVWVEKQEN